MLKKQALNYLGYLNQDLDEKLHKLFDEAILDIQKIASFRHTYGTFNIDVLDFSNRAYKDFILDSKRIIIVCGTLGSDIDKLLKKLSKISMEKMVIYDAVANAYLEMMMDLEEQKMPYQNLSYRFAPGYQGTDIKIIHEIIQLLDANKKLGISVLSSNLMVPQKSIVGLLVEGKRRATCKGCLMLNHCEYLKRGITCY